MSGAGKWWGSWSKSVDNRRDVNNFVTRTGEFSLTSGVQRNHYAP